MNIPSVKRIRECDLIDMLIEILNFKPCSLDIKSVNDLYKPLTNASVDCMVKLCNGSCECLKKRMRGVKTKNG